VTLVVESTRSGKKASGPIPGGSRGSAAVADHADTSIIQTESPGLGYLNPRLVEKLRGQLRAQTAECVMETFGISVRTWMKMRDGMPVRRSVAERLLQRVGMDL